MQVYLNDEDEIQIPCTISDILEIKEAIEHRKCEIEQFNDVYDSWNGEYVSSEMTKEEAQKECSKLQNLLLAFENVSKYLNNINAVTFLLKE